MTINGVKIDMLPVRDVHVSTGFAVWWKTGIDGDFYIEQQTFPTQAEAQKFIKRKVEKFGSRSADAIIKRRIIVDEPLR